MNKKIIFTTGGTGGHILPAINMMKHFSEKGNEVILVTDSRGSSYMKNYLNFKVHKINASTLTNKKFLNKIFSTLIIFYSVIKSIIILYKEKPNLIFGFGGYVSFPISLSSKLFRIPLVIYENNMILGRANKSLATLSKKILLAKKISDNFPKKYISKTSKVGSILDKKIINRLNLTKNISKEKFNILILGGSQGAEIFGTIVPDAIKLLKNEGYIVEIKQQCILNQKESLETFYRKNDIKNYIFKFDRNILDLILSSNLVITRCGASTTAELAHTLTPFIAVPLPESIDNHQFLNAKYYENKGSCWLLEQKNFTSENLFSLIVKITKDKNNLENIRKNLKNKYSMSTYVEIENIVKNLFKYEN